MSNLNVGFDRSARVALAAFAIAAFALGSGRASAAAAPAEAKEIWEGKLALPGGVALRIVVRVQREGNEVRAVMDSPDQGATGIAIDSVSFEGGVFRFESKAVRCRYSGALSASRDEAVGTFSQAGANLPLTFRRTNEAQELRRPQTPRAPFPYRAEEVAYNNTAQKITEANPTPHVRLAGTLLVPNGDGPFPAVLLITGSGPQDRDESLMGHKPFWVLADALARRGIAVLRVDDRGVAASTGDFSTATSADFAEDVEAGLAWLRMRKEIDSARVGLLGHSEGGLIAPLVASRTKVAFIVLLAGPGVPGDEVILTQGDRLAELAGKSAAARKKIHNNQRRLFDLIKAEPDPAALKEKARPLIAAAIDDLPAEERAAPGDPSRRIEALVAQTSSPWLRYFVTHDPRPVLSKVRCPVLALGGGKDLQVVAKKNLAAIRAALKAGGNRDVTIRELPGLNHLFQTAQTGSPSPFLDGHQYHLYLAAWFILQLYLVHLVFQALLWSSRRRWVLLVLAATIPVTIWLLHKGLVNYSDARLTAVRTSFAFLFFLLGYVVKQEEAALKRVLLWPGTLVICFVLVNALAINFGNVRYNIVLGNIGNQRVWVPLITTALIVAMVYQLSWHLAVVLDAEAWLIRLGRATLPILIWHFTVFFAIMRCSSASASSAKGTCRTIGSSSTASRPGCSTRYRRFGCRSGSIAL